MLDGDVELLDGLPIAFIKSLNSLVIADPHLGYEGVMAKRGVFLPKINLKNITDMLGMAAKSTGAKAVIVDGDIKNEFSDVDIEEFNELYDFIGFLRGIGVAPTLIKGNHDNFVERYREPFNLRIYGQEALFGSYLFFHGEELPREVGGAQMLVMGHEHPAIGVANEVGRMERLRCFLHGSYEGRELLVMPAINYFAPGTEVNTATRREALSPVLRRADIDGMRAIAIGFGSTIDFGTVGELRKAWRYKR